MVTHRHGTLRINRGQCRGCHEVLHVNTGFWRRLGSCTECRAMFHGVYARGLVLWSLVAVVFVAVGSYLYRVAD
jgi:hypothetical protein